jgi:hypothetical protein
MSSAQFAIRALTGPILLNEELQDAIQQHEATWKSNNAMKTLIGDYVKAHSVVVAVGGAMTIGLVLVSIVLWIRFRRIPRVETRKWGFEKRIHFAFGVLSTVVGLLMGLVVTVNALTVANPLPGFMLSGAHPTPNTAAVDTAVIGWIKSGNGPMPTIVQQKIDDRLDWQVPKAIVCSLLLFLLVLVIGKLWGLLVQGSRPDAQLTTNRGRLVAAELFAVSLGALMMMMVLGNVQGAIAPISITVFGGS